MFEVTVGVCIKNSEKIMIAALNSIAEQIYSHSLIKLIIVDDGSTDRTLDVAKEYASKIDIKTEVFHTDGYGLSFSRQLVVNNAEGNFVIFVDGDQQLPKDFIEKHVKFMEANPNIAAASGNELFRGDTLVALLESMSIAYQNRLSKSSNDVGGGVFRLEALKKVGGFDTTLKGAGEDVEVTNRMKKAGMTIAKDNADFYHNHRSTWRALWREYAWWGYGMHYVNHKQESGNYLLPRIPIFASFNGLKEAILLYRMYKRKAAFLLSFHSFFKNFAFCVGYLKSHLQAHGH